MGTVYLAEDLRLSRSACAIKEMSPGNLPPAERHWATQAFQQEAGVLAQLRHPGLTRVTDFFAEGSCWYLVMDFVEGETLEARLARVGRLAIPEAQEIFRQLCDVLSYLHNLQPPIIFRDLKPANIMLTPAGEVKLIDFGIARFFKPGQMRDTINLGTPGYAAPEQYGSGGQSDPRTDIYSLGIVLHQILTGYDPTVLPGVVLPPMHSERLGISAHVETAIQKATQGHPAQRFESIAAFYQALFAGSWQPGRSAPSLIYYEPREKSAVLRNAILLAVMLLLFVAFILRPFEAPVVTVSFTLTSEPTPAPSAAMPTGEISVDTATPSPTLTPQAQAPRSVRETVTPLPASTSVPESTSMPTPSSSSTPMPSPTPTPASEYETVRAGEGSLAVCRRHCPGISEAEAQQCKQQVIELNNLRGSNPTLWPGQKLRMPPCP